MTTFKNSFHGTSVTVRENLPGENQFDQFGNLSIFSMEERKPGRYTRMLKRIQKNLCGMRDCTCGTVR